MLKPCIKSWTLDHKGVEGWGCSRSVRSLPVLHILYVTLLSCRRAPVKFDSVRCQLAPPPIIGSPVWGRWRSQKEQLPRPPGSGVLFAICRWRRDFSRRGSQRAHQSAGLLPSVVRNMKNGRERTVYDLLIDLNIDREWREAAASWKKERLVCVFTRQNLCFPPSVGSLTTQRVFVVMCSVKSSVTDNLKYYKITNKQYCK